MGDELGHTGALRLERRLIAAVRGRQEGMTGQIGRLTVAPDLTARGLGTRLTTVINGAVGARGRHHIHSLQWRQKPALPRQGQRSRGIHDALSVRKSKRLSRECRGGNDASPRRSPVPRISRSTPA